MFKCSFGPALCNFSCGWYVLRSQMSSKTKYMRADLRPWVTALSANHTYLPLFFHSFLDVDTSKHISGVMERVSLISCFCCHHHRPHFRDTESGGVAGFPEWGRSGLHEDFSPSQDELLWAWLPTYEWNYRCFWKKLVFIICWTWVNWDWRQMWMQKQRRKRVLPSKNAPDKPTNTKTHFLPLGRSSSTTGECMLVCHALRPGVIKLSLDTSRRPTMEERLRRESVNCVCHLLSDMHRRNRRIYGLLWTFVIYMLNEG